MEKMELEEAGKFLQKGIDLETSITASGLSIREASKIAYGDLTIARLTLVAILYSIFEKKSGVPGNSNKERSDILTLIMAFTQGIDIVEKSISEGQYTKACAILKQDYEIIARIGETRKGLAKAGITPNVKHAPEGTQRFYGDINNFAHPSNIGLLQFNLSELIDGDIRGVSFLPKFNKELATQLYRWHVWTLFEIARHAFLLFHEMYDDEPEFKRDMYLKMQTAISIMNNCGFEDTK
jgi:hypothetical protein